MSTRTDVIDDLVVEPRTPRTDRRVDLYLLLLATVVAFAVYFATSYVVLPPPEALTAFVAVQPVTGVLALLVLWSRSRGGADEAIRWFACGVVVAIAGQVVNLLALSSVSPHGGPFGTDIASRTGIYLVYHLAISVAAVAAAFRAPARWRAPFTGVGLVLVAGLAVNLVPTPTFVMADGTYTTVLVVANLSLAVLTLAADGLWVWRVGRATTPLRGWVGVALTLGFFDLLFNALGGARFAPVFWASVTTRAATYVVLAVGCVLVVLAELRRSEAYSDSELDRREAQLESSLAVTRLLLDATEQLSRAVTLDDVVRVATDNLSAAVPGVEVAVAVRGRGTVSSDEELVAAVLDGRDDSASDPVFSADEHDVARSAPLVPGVVQPTRRPRSLAVVPMTSADRLCGHLVLWSTRPRPWSALDRKVLTGLAYQAALAVVRAEAFEDQARAAQTLQRSLLPGELQALERLSLGAVYRPGAEGSRVGGDWFDSIPLRDGRVALVIGDVMGKGLRAAALMGQVRTAVRAAAAADPSPASVLTVLDEVGMGLQPDEIVTMTYALVDLDAGTASLGRAGHLPPLILDVDGRAQAFYGGDSTPLGTPDPVRTESTVPFPAGSVVVLFTDGVVERRCESITDGLDRLLADVERIGPVLRDDPQAAVEQVIAQAVGDDDLAVLVASHRPHSDGTITHSAR